MRTVELSEASQSLGAYAKALGKETTVVTSGRKPVAALIGLEGVPEEALALSTNPDFLRLIQAARDEVRDGRTVPLAALKWELV